MRSSKIADVPFRPWQIALIDSPIIGVIYHEPTADAEVVQTVDCGPPPTHHANAV